MKTPERDGLRSGVWFNADLRVCSIFPSLLMAPGDVAVGSSSGQGEDRIRRCCSRC